MKYNSSIKIDELELSINSPTFFIADIASNHNGDIERAKELIWQAKETGANAVKFQHFLADKIVSDYGFRNLGVQKSHQSKWGKSVYEVYKECECNRDWSSELAETAKSAKIIFMTTPYDITAVEELDKYVPAYKIGSGDITWLEFIGYLSRRNKPIFLATGASSMFDVERAVDEILAYNRDIVIMQCNTNYTGDLANFKYVNLNVLKLFSNRYPNMVLGLSDHTRGHATVLGAITLGARVIEKHFTLDNNLVGPDHAFSMNPVTWSDMVEYARELESALGSGVKKVEDNEKETVILQRRCLRFRHAMFSGQKIGEADLESLRPAPSGAVLPYQIIDVIGKVLLVNKEKGDKLEFEDLEVRVC